MDENLVRDAEFKVTLKNDYLFKRLLGSEENKHILQNFLELVLCIPHEEIEDLQLLDKELKKDQIDDKTGILDVKIRLKNRTIINIEIQALWDDSFIFRTLFYWAKIYVEEFKQGEDYTDLRKCVVINIVGKGFNLSDRIHSRYGLKEIDTHDLLTDIVEIHFLNLEKAKKLKDIADPLVRWLLFIDTNSKEERAMLSKNSPVLAILNEKINVLALSPEEKKLYESRMMLKSDIVSISNSQFKKGMAQGIAQGMAQGKMDGIREESFNTARRMKKANCEISFIMEMTGLKKTEIEAL